MENKEGIQDGIPDTLLQRYKEVSLHLSVLGIEISP
jgi:hypothetical protein